MKIKSGFVLEEVGGSYLAVAVGQRTDEFTGFVKLNETGAFLWNLMQDKSISCDGLVEALMAECVDAKLEEVEKGVDAFILNLKNGGILEDE